MTPLHEIKSLLEKAAKEDAYDPRRFFKVAPGDYAHHDRFMGVRTPALRKIAQEYAFLNLEDLQSLVESPFNEERLLTLFILVHQFQHSDPPHQDRVFQFYLKNLGWVNNWNLVDVSAHLIVGAHLLDRKDKSILTTLVHSEKLWERRVAIVATWAFIREGQFDWTIKLAALLLRDSEDLMHKAVGWMLREVGKKDQAVLERFLSQHKATMPRTMLRYAIERFPEPMRRAYLEKGVALAILPLLAILCPLPC